MGHLDEYMNDLKSVIDRIPLEKVEEIIQLLHQTRMNGKQIFILGNGGSASTASHMVCDLAKNTRKQGLPHFRVFGLTDNMAIMTAYANDEGYDTVFANQLDNLIEPGDLVIAISASGNSPNVIKAVELANQRRAITVGFTGMTGGKLIHLAQISIHVPSMRIEQVEDVHLMLEHMICSAIKNLEIPVQTGEIITQEPLDKAEQLFGFPVATESQFQFDQSELLDVITREFSEKLDLHEFLPKILDFTVQSVGATSGSIVVLDENGEVIEGAITYAGEVLRKSTNTLNRATQEGLANWVIENRQPALVENTMRDPRWMKSEPQKVQTDVARSAICVPLMVQDRVAGVLTLSRASPYHFTMEDLAMLTTITVAISYSFRRKA